MSLADIFGLSKFTVHPATKAGPCKWQGQCGKQQTVPHYPSRHQLLPSDQTKLEGGLSQLHPVKRQWLYFRVRKNPLTFCMRMPSGLFLGGRWEVQEVADSPNIQLMLRCALIIRTRTHQEMRQRTWTFSRRYRTRTSKYQKKTTYFVEQLRR